MLFLKIENPGVCSSEGFTVFGATTKRESHNPLVIGTFGSGTKNSTGLLLRASINPVIFCGPLRMSFFTRPMEIKGVANTVEQKRVCVRYAGTNTEGKSQTREEELSVTLDYGVSDWPSVNMAMREYVSNALDACFEVGMNVQEARRAVKIEVVDENQVRAKNGNTRIFVPLTPDIQTFYDNLGKWFLHFSEPELVEQAILPKRNRNVTTDKQVAVIYRKGVFVREFLSDDEPSLFDYNLNDLQLNESRTASDWDVKYYASLALAAADQPTLSKVFLAMRKGENSWEMTFDAWSLRHDTSEERSKVWQEAFEAVAGPEGVLMNESQCLAEMVEKKGYKPLRTQAKGWVDAGNKLGIRSEEKVLTQGEREGRTFSEATPAVIAALDWVWNIITTFDMANGKDKPAVGCFHKHLVSGAQEKGLYDSMKGKILIHTDIAGADTEELRIVMMHEAGHHASQSTDFSYDFNVWFNRLCVRMRRRFSEHS